MRKNLLVKGAALAVLVGALFAGTAIADGEQYRPSGGGAAPVGEGYFKAGTGWSPDYPSSQNLLLTSGTVAQAKEDFRPTNGGVVRAGDGTAFFPTAELAVVSWPDFEAGALDLRA
ncbi:hypothetical protein ACIA8O_39475 [Kitasatospora sp. NPDC051853]|uniref:hypothetical protein n=1 Tax=Kitasatospora sp. NPDC051853 TaxID=3364058 RepID=UPI0037A49903